jgi:hypothetical protein
MDPLPVPDLRSNVATWAVPSRSLPAVAAIMRNLYPTEDHDPSFLGQRLRTTYFDTPDFRLRKARLRKDKYLTLRIRCYEAPDGGELYALSAKTESVKFRVEIEPLDAERALAGIYPDLWVNQLPIDLYTRLLVIAGDDNSLVSVVTVGCKRYAVQDSRDRITLDCDVRTDTDRCLPYHALEFKSTSGDATPPGSFQALGLRPVKLSKFLWATQP